MVLNLLAATNGSRKVLEQLTTEFRAHNVNARYISNLLYATLLPAITVINASSNLFVTFGSFERLSSGKPISLVEASEEVCRST